MLYPMADSLCASHGEGARRPRAPLASLLSKSKPSVPKVTRLPCDVTEGARGAFLTSSFRAGQRAERRRAGARTANVTLCVSLRLNL